MTYEDFVKSFNKARKKGDSREPMSEENFNEMMGLDKREEPVAPKVIKTKQPTLGLNIVDTPRVRISKPDKPNEPKPKRSYSKRLSDWKRPNKSGRVMVAPKISYKGMSAEEIKAHKAKLAREWRARTGKTNGKHYSEYTVEEKKALSEQKKDTTMRIKNACNKKRGTSVQTKRQNKNVPRRLRCKSGE